MTFSDKTFTFGTMGQDKIAYTWKKSGTSMTISATAGLATLTGTITDNQFKGTLSVTDKAGKVKSWDVATAEADSKKAK